MAAAPGVGGIARVGPVVEQRSEVHHRIADRRHVPVEDRGDPVGVRRVELAVVELRIVVDQCGRRRGGQRRSQPARHVVHERDRVDLLHPRPAVGPAVDLPLDEAGRSPQVGQLALGGVEERQVGERVHDGEAEPPSELGVVGQRVGQFVAHDLAPAPLHDEEVGPDDVVVVAEDERPRRPVEVPPEPGQHLVLAAHVVGSRRDGPERRPAEDQLGVPDAEQVGEVGAPPGELQDLDVALEVGQRLLQEPLQPGQVELVAAAHLGRLVGHGTDPTGRRAAGSLSDRRGQRAGATSRGRPASSALHCASVTGRRTAGAVPRSRATALPLRREPSQKKKKSAGMR